MADYDVDASRRHTTTPTPFANGGADSDYSGDMADESKSHADGRLSKSDLAALTAARNGADALESLGGQAGLAEGLGVDLQTGIAASEVPTRQARYGQNRLPVAPPTSLWEHFKDSLDDRDLKILVVAAVSSVLFGMFVTADMDDAIQGYAAPRSYCVLSCWERHSP